MSRLDHQAEIWRQRPIVCRPRRLIVLIWRWNVIRKLAGSLIDLALIVRLSVVFILLSHGLHFIDRVCVADERAPRDAVEGVAR